MSEIVLRGIGILNLNPRLMQQPGLVKVAQAPRDRCPNVCSAFSLPYAKLSIVVDVGVACEAWLFPNGSTRRRTENSFFCISFRIRRIKSTANQCNGVKFAYSSTQMKVWLLLSYQCSGRPRMIPGSGGCGTSDKRNHPP